jgi:hypothetical protein
VHLAWLVTVDETAFVHERTMHACKGLDLHAVQDWVVCAGEALGGEDGVEVEVAGSSTSVENASLFDQMPWVDVPEPVCQ